MIRDYTKWDDQPASPQAAVESVLRANQITRSAPYGPVYICLDAGLAGVGAHGRSLDSRSGAFRAGAFAGRRRTSPC